MGPGSNNQIPERGKVCAVQFQQIESLQERLGLVPPMTQELEWSHSLRVTTHHLAVDQAGPHLEVVHGFDHERVALRPVIAPAGNQPDADRVAPVAVVLDFVQPAGTDARRTNFPVSCRHSRTPMIRTWMTSQRRGWSVAVARRAWNSPGNCPGSTTDSQRSCCFSASTAGMSTWSSGPSPTKRRLEWTSRQPWRWR